MEINAINVSPGFFPAKVTLNEPVAGGFSEMLVNEMNHANQKIIEAEQAVQDLATGQTENLHQVIIAIQEAKLSFELAVQVRNKLLESYQEIIKMQV